MPSIKFYEPTSPLWSSNLQFSEKRPVVTDPSVRKTTKSDEPVDVMVDVGAAVQNLPSNGELSLEPSYSDTLS